jgi:hypothetical protein
MIYRSRLAVVSSLLAFAACAGPTAATKTEPAMIQISNPNAFVRTTDDAPGIVGGLVGDFRVKPGPGPDGTIRLTLGDSLILNGSNFHPVAPDGPGYLIANWGDGNGNERVGCGSCRITHVYQAAGRFTLEMTFDDGIPTSERATPAISATVTVVVEGLPVPPSVVGKPPTATFASLSGSCSDLKITSTYKVNDADGDAVSWSVAVTGATLTSPASGGPVPAGTTVTILYTLAPGANTVEFDVVDATGLHSHPVVTLTLPFCGALGTLTLIN